MAVGKGLGAVVLRIGGSLAQLGMIALASRVLDTGALASLFTFLGLQRLLEIILSFGRPQFLIRSHAPGSGGRDTWHAALSSAGRQIGAGIVLAATLTVVPGLAGLLEEDAYFWVLLALTSAMGAATWQMASALMVLRQPLAAMAVQFAAAPILSIVGLAILSLSKVSDGELLGTLLSAQAGALLTAALLVHRSRLRYRSADVGTMTGAPSGEGRHLRLVGRREGMLFFVLSVASVAVFVVH